MFFGRLSRGAYGRAVLIRVGLFIAGHAAVFAALSIIAWQRVCISEGCMAFVAVLATFIAFPAFYVLLVLSMIGISIRRVRDIGLPAVLGLAVPILMLGNVLPGITLASKILGSLRHPELALMDFPRFLLVAIVCIGFLCLVRSKEETGAAAAPPWGLAGAIALGAIVLSTIGAAVGLCQYLVSLLGGPGTARAFRTIMVYYGLFGTTGLLLVTLGIVLWQQRAIRPEADGIGAP